MTPTRRARPAGVVAAGLVCLAVVGSAAAARAQEATDPSVFPPRVHLDLGAGTTVPTLLGFELTVEDIETRFLFQLQLGYLPPVYADLITAVVVAFGVTDQETADFIAESIDSSGASGLWAGWRPFQALGLELYLGYQWITFGGGLGSTATAESRAGADFEGMAPPFIPLEATVHVLSLRAGWRFMLSDWLVLRASLGYLQALDVQLRLKLETYGLVERVVTAAEQAISQWLTEVFREEVKAPTLTVTLSYRFY